MVPCTDLVLLQTCHNVLCTGLPLPVHVLHVHDFIPSISFPIIVPFGATLALLWARGHDSAFLRYCGSSSITCAGYNAFISACLFQHIRFALTIMQKNQAEPRTNLKMVEKTKALCWNLVCKFGLSKVSNSFSVVDSWFVNRLPLNMYLTMQQITGSNVCWRCKTFRIILHCDVWQQANRFIDIIGTD